MKLAIAKKSSSANVVFLFCYEKVGKVEGECEHHGAHIPLRDRKARADSNSLTRKQLLGYQL